MDTQNFEQQQEYPNPFMLAAIKEARRGIKKGHGGPFGAVVVRNGEIVGRGHNQVLNRRNPVLHGEIMAISDACKRLNTHDLYGCDVYSTSEPCPMCLAACMWANTRNNYYGCTLKDNELIGFRDNKFNDVLHIDRSKIDNLHELDRDECLKLFEKYNKMRHKKIY